MDLGDPLSPLLSGCLLWANGGSSGETRRAPPDSLLMVHIIVTSSNSKPSPEFLWFWVFHLMWFLKLQLILKGHLIFQAKAQDYVPGRGVNSSLNFIPPLLF